MNDTLVSDNQGRETARLGRNIGLERAVYQTALTDGTIQRVLCAIRDGLPITTGSPLGYPDGVLEHLTPELEAPTVRNPGKVELWLDPRQTSGVSPTLHEVYEAIKAEGLLERSLSLGELEWYEAHPDQIPPEFKGKWIYGWASVVQISSGLFQVPALMCDFKEPYVGWSFLKSRCDGEKITGLRTS